MKISSDLIRVHKSLHTWVGIVAGLLLFVGFFAGALTMFKAPLDRWVRTGATPEATHWPGGLDDRLLPELLARQPQALPEFTVHLQPAAHLDGPVSWTSADGAVWVGDRDAQGNPQWRALPVSPLGELVDLLHRTGGVPGLLGDEHVGVYLMGVAAVLYFLALVSGLVVVVPTLVKDFFAVRPGPNRKRFWLDVHNVLGITSLPFHVVISLTVIVFAFHDQFYGALSKVVYGRQTMFTPPPAAAQPFEPQALMPLSQLLTRVRDEAPGFAPVELLYMRTATPRPMVRVALVHPQALVHGPRAAYLVLNPYTGAVVNATMLPGRENGWSAPVNTFFALHFGSFGGLTVRWVYFALGLMGAALFYTGNLLWLETRRKRQRDAAPPPVQSRSVRAMAALTVGVSLGCVLGVAVALMAGKAWAGRVEDASGLYLTSYYLTWLGSMAWAAWRSAARAASELLWACGLAGIALPVCSAMLGIGAWQGGGNAAAQGVESTALALGLLCLWAAWRTQQRVRSAGPDTIWARPAANQAAAVV